MKLLQRLRHSSRVTRFVLLSLGSTSFGGAVLFAGIYFQAQAATVIAGLYVLGAVWWVYTALERANKE